MLLAGLRGLPASFRNTLLGVPDPLYGVCEGEVGSGEGGSVEVGVGEAGLLLIRSLDRCAHRPVV